MTAAAESRSARLALIPIGLLMHNAEEGLTLGGALPRLSEALAVVAGRQILLPTEHQYHVALVAVTLLGFAVYAAARVSCSAVYPLVVLQAAMTLNVLTHTASAIALEGYTPGLVTAWLIEAPTSIIVLRSVWRDGSMSGWQWRWLAPLALLLHGPLLVTLLAFVRRLA